MRCGFRYLLSATLLFMPALLLSCNEQGSHKAADAAIGQGYAFLAKQQKQDGSFRSSMYPILGSGHSLTAVICHCFTLGTKHQVSQHAGVLERALGFLATEADQNGRLGLTEDGVDYPNYARAFYLLALTRAKPAGWRERAERQLAQLRATQLVEALDWQASDPQYGGFGLGEAALKKPLGAGYLNISVTAWVVHAMKASGHPSGAAVFDKASVFIERCQNFGMKSAAAGDGGFFFTTFPPFQQSKAGLQLRHEAKEIPTLSYGSTTADGIRGLLACGADVGSPRLRAARLWIEKNFDVRKVPGFPKKRVFAPGEEALRLYYLASLAQAMRDIEQQGAQFKGKASNWRKSIQDRLLSLQASDGSWRGHVGMKEDDPLVATPLALLALLATRH